MDECTFEEVEEPEVFSSSAVAPPPPPPPVRAPCLYPRPGPPRTPRKKRAEKTNLSIVSRAVLEKRREVQLKNKRDRSKALRDNWTPEEREKRLAHIRKRNRDKYWSEEAQRTRFLKLIKRNITNKIRRALETPAEREQRMQQRRDLREEQNSDKITRRGCRKLFSPETPLEKQLREILVREALAVEVGEENAMKRAELLEKEKNEKEMKKKQSTYKMTVAQREMHSFWNSDWEGILPSDEEESDEDDEEEELESESDDNEDDVDQKKGSLETLEDWALRVSDIFNARIQDKSQQQQTKTAKDKNEKKPVEIEGTASTSQLKEDKTGTMPIMADSKSRSKLKEDLLSAVSAEKAERVVLVEAEIAERRAALADETAEDREARINRLIEEAKDSSKRSKEKWEKLYEDMKKRREQRAAGGEVSGDDKPRRRRTKARKRTDLTEEELASTRKKLADYMRARNDLLKAEWETWLGLRDASAPLEGSPATSLQATGTADGERAMAWLEENKEEHRWGIETGAAVKPSKKVPDTVIKYRLTLATLVDETRSGLFDKKEAEATLVQLLSNNRSELEEFFYGRRTYVQRMASQWENKLDLEKRAARKARLNEKLRERYRDQRLAQGKQYDPGSRGQSFIKDKTTILKEMKGEIPKSTRGVTKTDARRHKKPKPVVRDGKVLHVSGCRFNAAPGRREIRFDKPTSSSSVSTAIPSTVDNKPVETEKTAPDVTAADISVPLPVPAVVKPPTRRSTRTRTRPKNKTPPPTPPPEDSDSDWVCPADVDESLFEDDDSRGGGSLEESATPPAPPETWRNDPPTLQPFSTLSQAHSQSLFPNVPYYGMLNTQQSFPPPINLGHGLLLGNPTPNFAAAAELPQLQHTQVEVEPSFSPVHDHSVAYASSTYSDDPEPPELTREEDNYSSDEPVLKKRRGRPPSTSGRKYVKKATATLRTRQTKSQKVPYSFLRPQGSIGAGKVPTVTHAELLITPAKPGTESQVQTSPDQLKCPTCSEEFEDEQQMNAHKINKHSDVTDDKKGDLLSETNNTEEESETINFEKHLDVGDVEDEADVKEKDDADATPKKKRRKAPTSVSLNCPLCNVVVKGGEIFNRHLWTAHWKDERNTDLRACPICSFALKGQGARFYFYLSRHIKGHHAETEKEIFIPGVYSPQENKEKISYKQFMCVLCSTSFPAYLPLARHMEDSHARACPVCGIILQVNDHLKDHVELFHPEERYSPQETLNEEQLKDCVSCSRCLSRFVDADHLNSHKEGCKQDKVSTWNCWWKCSERIKFNTHDDLQRHHGEFHGEDTVVPTEGCDDLHCVYKCELCRRRFYTLPFLRVHSMKDHPEVPALPDTTSVEPVLMPNTRPKSDDPSLLVAPKPRKRTVAKPEDYPNLKFKSRVLRIPQLSDNPNTPSYTCGECSMTFTSNEFCRLHKGYRKLKRRCCRICGAQYAHIESLITHNRQKHDLSAEDNSRLENEDEERRLQLAHQNNEPILKCAICVKYFIAREFHLMHSSMGKDLDPDVRRCPHCPDVAFSRKKLLDEHLELYHSDSFTAAEAARRLEEIKEKRKEKYQASVKLVQGNEEWPCVECGSTFTLKSSMLRHRRNVHNGMAKRYACPQCDHRSTRVEQLRNHIKAIHELGGRQIMQTKKKPSLPYIPDKYCTMCPKRFATDGALQIHIKKLHGQEILCYACGETVKDVKAHNQVCVMGGIEEDALREEEDPNMGTRWKAKKVAKLPLLGLLKLLKEQEEKEAKEKEPRRKVVRKVKKIKTSVSDESGGEKESDEDEKEGRKTRRKAARKAKKIKTSVSDESGGEKESDADEKEGGKTRRKAARKAKKIKTSVSDESGGEKESDADEKEGKKTRRKTARKAKKIKTSVSDESGGEKESDEDESIKTEKKLYGLRKSKSTKTQEDDDDFEFKPRVSRSKEKRPEKRKKMTDVTSKSKRKKSKQKKKHSEKSRERKRNTDKANESDAEDSGDSNSSRLDRPKRSLKKSRRKKSSESSGDLENNAGESDHNWDDGGGTDFEEIVVKEEVDDFENDEFYIDLPELVPDSMIDEPTCLIPNCPCEKGKWESIIHGGRSAVVKAVKCDAEIYALLKARRERKQKLKEEARKQETLQIQRNARPTRFYARKPVTFVDPLQIANSLSPRVNLRSATPPVASSSSSSGWTQLTHIGTSKDEENESESSDEEEDTNDPPYDPLAC